jgi:hypothetical protein
MKISSYIIIWVCLLIISCDMDKFTGNNYDSSPIPKNAKIFGKIYNVFDDKPVPWALVNFGNQATFTDTAGYYLLQYYLGSDESRNKPVDIQITAPGFLKYFDEKIILPENNYNFLIEYGAPTILQVARIDSYCQAIIFDNQGFDNISTVIGRFFYRRQGDKQTSLVSELGMNGHETDSSNIGYYQCKVALSIPGYGDLIPTFYVYAHDKNALKDSTSYARSGVDSLLFPIYPN